MPLPKVTLFSAHFAACIFFFITLNHRTQQCLCSVLHFSFVATMFHSSITALVSFHSSSCFLPAASPSITVRLPARCRRPFSRLTISLAARTTVYLLRLKVLNIAIFYQFGSNDRLKNI
ncbi:hypothetical protein PIB30_007599 [Stylosanthes scabra]|uniref:Secreted protein n=1 Tax=Stylosanthes scabra TaxID=79078 RepID=A0ABU6U468_9FABA|nr:hypothetical protein [Stylosanthes scabra]